MRLCVTLCPVLSSALCFCCAQGLALQEIAVACLPGGAMSPFSKAANPIIATIGGLLGPIGFFFAMSSILYGMDSYGEMPPEHRPINGGTCGAVGAPPPAHRRLGGTSDGPVINITDPFPEKYSYEIIAMGWVSYTTNAPLPAVSCIHKILRRLIDLLWQTRCL